MSQNKTPVYRIRSNRVQNKLKSLCLEWMKANTPPGVLKELRRKAKRAVSNRVNAHS